MTIFKSRLVSFSKYLVLTCTKLNKEVLGRGYVCVCVCVRERERERKRQTDRQRICLKVKEFESDSWGF